jgi:hypothetical protein
MFLRAAGRETGSRQQGSRLEEKDTVRQPVHTLCRPFTRHVKLAPGVDSDSTRGQRGTGTTTAPGNRGSTHGDLTTHSDF